MDFKFIIHDANVDEPIAWVMTEEEAKLIMDALNEKHAYEPQTE